MKVTFGINSKIRSFLPFVVIVPLALLILFYAQSRYGTSQESATPREPSPRVQPQTKQDEQDHIRTEVVKRLLSKLDTLDDVSPDEKRDLEKILREADRYLAEAASQKSGAASSPLSRDGGSEVKKLGANGKQQTVRSDLGKSASLQEQTTQAESHSSTAPSSEAQTASIRALLQLLDEVIEDEVADTTQRSEQKDELRESLLEADKVLRQYLGDSSRARIEAANRKPSIPNVYNPRRKPASQPANN